MKQIIISFTFILACQFAFAQNQEATSPTNKSRNFSIRANANYQYFSFNGRRTNSMAIGGILEKTISYESTVGLGVNYLTRMEDGDIQNKNMPSYQEVLYFAPFVRKYFHRAMEGAYSGFTVGIGIPSGKGTQWDFGGMLGYNILHNKISVDINLNMGFGSFRHYEDVVNGFVTSEVFLVDYGFYFRPGLSIGLVN